MDAIEGQPRQLSSRDSEDIADVLELIQRSFAYMKERIDPPSSAFRLTPDAIGELADTGEVWVIGTKPIACIVYQPTEHALYIGRLAVDEAYRGKGLARTLVELAASRALAHNLPVIELKCRVELVENKKIFEALGFQKTGEGTHEGYDRPTYIIMQNHLAY